MRRDKRQSIRRQMRYSAMLMIEGDVQRACRLSDISETGARIDVETSDELPDRFVLLLSGERGPRRTCRVVWRKPKQVGVSFDGRVPADERAGLVPAMNADRTAEGDRIVKVIVD